MQVRNSSLKRASQHFRTSRKWAQSSSVGVAAQIGWVGIPVGVTAGLYWEQLPGYARTQNFPYRYRPRRAWNRDCIDLRA
jgi:hypothetical protein